jgi:hypothetical protein
MSQASGSSGPVNGGRGEISALGGFWRWLRGRAAMTSEEVQLLRGLARQIQWAAGQAGLAADGSNVDPPGDPDR